MFLPYKFFWKSDLQIGYFEYSGKIFYQFLSFLFSVLKNKK